MDNIAWGILVIVFIVLGILSTWSAYRNGVVDGYGYSREPNNPGYQKAGAYLTKHMQHRWSALRPAGGGTSTHEVRAKTTQNGLGQKVK